MIFGQTIFTRCAVCLNLNSFRMTVNHLLTDPVKHNQMGYYMVGDDVFINKIQASMAATTLRKPMSFHWFDEIFDGVDRSLIGTRSLPDLYRERAQQLRDSYDYLILYYSGGADSLNILRTFLDNGIRLDQITVKCPTRFVDSSVHVPNTVDLTAANILSEWDYVTKPDLEKISRHHPEIRIEILDWSLDFINNNNFVREELFETVSFLRLGRLSINNTHSVVERQLLDQGKKVGVIWGIDKPCMYVGKDDSVVMRFADDVIAAARPAPYNISGTEYFYWTPKMPLLAFEMAYQTAIWFSMRPKLRHLMFRKDSKYGPNDTPEHAMARLDANQQAAKAACYSHTWVQSRFQVQKSLNMMRTDEEYWLYQHPEFLHHVRRWVPMYRSFIKTVDPSLCEQRHGKNIQYRGIKARPHYVCHLPAKPFGKSDA